MVGLPNVAIIKYGACSLGNHQTDKSITIPAEMITDFEITYPTNISSVYGSVTFDGMFDFEKSIGAGSDLVLTILYDDAFGERTFREFAVTNISKRRDGQVTSVTLFLQDQVSYIMSKTHIPWNFKEITPKELYNKVYDKYIKEKVVNETKFICNEEIKLKNFCVPANKSFWEYFEWQLNINNLMIIQTRRTIEIINRDKVKDSDVVKSDIEYAELLHRDMPNKIYEYKKLDEDNNQKPARTQLMAFNPETKTFKYMDNNAKDIGLDEKEQPDYGYKATVLPYLDDNYQKYKNNTMFQNSVGLEIITPACFRVFNKFVGIKVKVTSTNPNYDERAKGLESDSGEYVVVGFTDKLINSRWLVTRSHVTRRKNK